MDRLSVSRAPLRPRAATAARGEEERSQRVRRWADAFSARPAPRNATSATRGPRAATAARGKEERSQHVRRWADAFNARPAPRNATSATTPSAAAPAAVVVAAAAVIAAAVAAAVVAAAAAAKDDDDEDDPQTRVISAKAHSITPFRRRARHLKKVFRSHRARFPVRPDGLSAIWLILFPTVER